MTETFLAGRQLAKRRFGKHGCPGRSRPRLDQLQSLCLNRVEYGVTQKRAGVENLDTDHLILVIQLNGNVWIEFDASGFWLLGNEQVEHIFLLEVFDTWVIHG